MNTVFKYTCCCGKTDFLKLNAEGAHCKTCDVMHPISNSGVIRFFKDLTNQNIYFDSLYADGYEHARDVIEKDNEVLFNTAKERSGMLLKSLGFQMQQPLEQLSILDAACGSGWVTAGFLQNEKINHCKLHAFDISPHGPEMLSRFNMSLKTTNDLEMSVQDAEAMNFGDATFDLIIGSSILHHFDCYEKFLKDCRRILKPKGKVLFGEPFAIGYGLGAAALLIAQKQLGTQYKMVDALYKDISFRNKSSRAMLNNLVDKHLFFQSTFIQLANQIGFSSVEFNSPNPPEYYRDHFINELLRERGIVDARLTEEANKIYEIIFDLFDAKSFEHSISPFMDIVLTQ
ncbi:class I SAM-dependent methyltransferase [bacterium]|nr:class I SAM-dependent methyltransferase [bacterium]